MVFQVKKRILKTVTIAVAALVLVWAAAFAADYTRSASLKEPIFAFEGGDTGIYRGIGYTVEVERYTDPELGEYVGSVEMKMLGKIVSASIS